MLIARIILALSVLTMAVGCSHDVYQPRQYQSVLLTKDVTAQATFPVPMPDGSVQMVIAPVALRAGWLAKELTSTEYNAYEAGLAKDLAAKQPGK